MSPLGSTDPIKKSTLRYNCYTKQYIIPKQPKTMSTYHKHIKYSSNTPTDDRWIGDEMVPMPHPRATRFWFQNCHGLLNAKDITKFHYEMNTFFEQNIHYLSLAETNVNSNHTFTKYQIEHSFKSLAEHGRIDMNNTPGFTKTSSYQPGGVAAGFHGRLCNRFSKTIKDQCGRWIAHEFVGRTHTLKIYTVYRVNPNSRRGDITAWQQQKRFLQTQKNDADPRKQIIDDLIKSLERDRANGTNVILFGDFNEKLFGRENTHNRLQNIGLVNLLQHGLQQDNLPRTHKTGSGAIDHMYISGGILNAVQYAGMAPFDFIGSTDHRGLYCDLFLDEILDTNIIPLQAFPHRRLKSSIPKRVKKYLEVVKSQWDHQNIDKRLNSVIDNLSEYDITTLEKKLNDIDQSITNLLRHAEKKCAQVPKNCNIYWSPKLKKALDHLHKCRQQKTKQNM